MVPFMFSFVIESYKAHSLPEKELFIGCCSSSHRQLLYHIMYLSYLTENTKPDLKHLHLSPDVTSL